MSDFVRYLRNLSGLHMGVDLVERFANAQRDQQKQGEALAKAAERIEQLEAELAQMKAESHAQASAAG